MLFVCFLLVFELSCVLCFVWSVCLSAAVVVADVAVDVFIWLCAMVLLLLDCFLLFL